jgi:hypothetical protein
MNPGLAQLTAWALGAMAYHDFMNRVFGFNHLRNRLANQPTARCRANPGMTARICAAVNMAACFYFKPVHCLQKSVVTARLLRKCGIDCKVVIGYRQAPFVSHAWVEVDGRVVNDSPAYKEQLAVLSVI